VRTSVCDRFRTTVQGKVVHFDAFAASVIPHQTWPNRPTGERVHNLKLKVYPLLIAAIGVIAASGGTFRSR
jgi:hypothetical protein